MARTLTLKCERRFEAAADAIRLWANDTMESLYENGERSPVWWAEQLPNLVNEFMDAAVAYELAPKSGPNAEIAG